jgi:hypothetical protein
MCLMSEAPPLGLLKGRAGLVRGEEPET